MKKLIKIFLVVPFLFGIANSLKAQNSSTNTSNSTTDMDRNDNSGKWGYLGLIGLLGLTGLKKKENTGTYTSAHIPPKS